MQILKEFNQPSSSTNGTYHILNVAHKQKAQDGLIATVIAYVFDAENRLLLTQHPTRGWGLPGGHREIGESVEDAIKREVLEETSVKIDNLQPIGYISMELIGEKPENYRYPFPIRIAQVFRAQAKEIQRFTPYHDALDRQFIPIPELQLGTMRLQYEDELLWLPYC